MMIYVIYSYDGIDKKKMNKRVSVLSSGPKRIGVKVVPKSMLPEKKKTLPLAHWQGYKRLKSN